MRIDVVSAMPYANRAALEDFMLVHRLTHDDTSAALQRAGKGQVATATINSEAATRAWAARMAREPHDAQPLIDWLQWHSSVHQAEFDALGFGDAPDLATVDFANETSFYDWLSVHMFVHDQVGAALGLT